MKQFRKWMKAKRNEDKLKHNLARNVVERMKMKAKEDSWEKI